MNKGWITAVLGLAIMVLSGGIGYAVSDARGAHKIASARSDTTTCIDANAIKEAALETVLDRLEKLRADHDTLRRAAELAIDSRDDEIAALTASANARQNRIKEAGKYDPDSAALVGVPVPAAIARELWPVAAQADRHTTDHD